MKKGRNRGMKVLLAVVVAAVVAALAVAFIVHDMRAEPLAATSTASPTPSASPSASARPTENPLPAPTYPAASSCGRKGEVNGLDSENVLGFNGLCIPLAVPLADHGKWNTGEEGDWVSNATGKVDYCVTQGCTSVALYADDQEYLDRTDCGQAPTYRNNVLVGGYAAVHAFIEKCGANLDMIQHVWVVETPEGSVAVVAESPASMDPGQKDGSATPARVGESMAAARVFDYAA